MANGAAASKNTQDRRNLILDELKKHGSIKNTDLSILFNCSEVTIRNDIRDMSTAGLLVRTHGGAVLPKDKESKPAVQKSIAKLIDEKRRIVEKAYEFISDGEAIIIDDSSTGYFLASHIAKHPEKELTIVTNGIRTAFELSEAAHIELHVIGGYVGGQSGGHLASTLGDEAVASIERLHADKGFIGVHSVNLDVGLTSIATPQMLVKRAIIGSSKQLFVLADHTKFENGYLSVVSPISKDFTIITDSGLEKETIDRAASMGLNLLVV